jgi:hypothetical protein
MSVKAGCTPRDDVLQGELNDAIFAASFGRLIRDEGPAVYRDPTLFFRNTYPTEALPGLCQRVFGPLANPAEAGRFFRLSTGFGGAKTHALMSLWPLARNIAEPTMGAHLLTPAGRPSEVRVVGVDAEGPVTRYSPIMAIKTPAALRPNSPSSSAARARSMPSARSTLLPHAPGKRPWTGCCRRTPPS